MTDRQTRQLVAVLDRLVDDERGDVPALVDLRRRTRRRLRRRAMGTVAASTLVLVSIAGAWTAVREREPSLLTVADSGVRLNDWVTLSWLPPDVVGAAFTGTNPPASMETFGYWQGHYRLSRGLDDPIVLHITLGDPFDAAAEVALFGGRATVEGSRVVAALDDGRTTISTAIGPASVQVIGDDPNALRQLLDGMIVNTPTQAIPGEPITLTHGDIEGIPWDLRVTTPSTSPASRSPGGACLILRVYTGGGVCLRPDESGVSVHSMSLPWARPSAAGPLWLLLGENGAEAFEYRLEDGTISRVEAASAAPASGVYAILDTGQPIAIANVSAIAADGTVLQTMDPRFSIP
jgi:hypothetical protein